jgi:hypothetical protein
LKLVDHKGFEDIYEFEDDTNVWEDKYKDKKNYVHFNDGDTELFSEKYPNITLSKSFNNEERNIQEVRYYRDNVNDITYQYKLASDAPVRVRRKLFIDPLSTVENVDYKTSICLEHYIIDRVSKNRFLKNVQFERMLHFTFNKDESEQVEPLTKVFDKLCKTKYIIDV